MKPESNTFVRSWLRRIAIGLTAAIAAAAGASGFLAAGLTLVVLLFDDDPSHSGSRAAVDLGSLALAAFAVAIILTATLSDVISRTPRRGAAQPSAQPQTTGPPPPNNPGRHR